MAAIQSTHEKVVVVLLNRTLRRRPSCRAPTVSQPEQRRYKDSKH